MNSPNLPGWTEAAIADAVIHAPRRSSVLLPETRVLDRAGWKQIVTPTFKTGGFNDIEIESLDAEAREAALDEGIAAYDREGIRFRIYVHPGPDAEAVIASLERRGFAKTFVRCMFRDVAPFADTLDPAIVVDPTTLETVNVFSDTMARGWDMDPAPLDRCNRLGLEGDPPQRLYVARVGGVPAGVAVMGTCEASAYLFGTVVLPEFRGRGVYKALVARRIQDAAAAGATLVTTQARDATSGPILARLGFHTIHRISVLSR